MASGIVMSSSIRPAGIRASATSGGRSDGRGRKSGGNWWTPLFGWPAEPDYIEAAAAGAGEERAAPRPAGKKFGGLTEEKARELRKWTMETESFHDVMYHSAIASRLASDLPSRRSGV